MKRGKTYDWIPLWRQKWLWGSTRIELNPGERSVWVDLLCIAGNDDGFIRANPETPYGREQLAGMLCLPLELLNSAIEKCIKYGKLGMDDGGILRVLSWEDYQLGPRYKKRLLSESEHSTMTSRSQYGGPIHIQDTDTNTETENKKAPDTIEFDHQSRSWKGVKPEDVRGWEDAYPACDVVNEMAKMREWILGAGPRGQKRAWRKFIVGWLKRTQADGGTRNGRPPAVDSRVGASTKKDHDDDYWAKVRAKHAEGKKGDE